MNTPIHQTPYLNYIKRIWSEDTGGGCMVDFVELWDGRILAVNDEAVCLFDSPEHFYSGDTSNCPYMDIEKGEKK